MDDALLVRRFERLGDLACDGQGLIDRNGSTRNAIGQSWSFDEFEDEGRDATGFLEAVDAADVRVVQAARVCASR
jgi:hypothetical protein